MDRKIKKTDSTPKYDIKGEKFNRLTALEYIKKSKWKCMCECGKTVTTTYNRLISGRVKSCGCLKTERVSKLNLSHGMTETPTHNSWTSMLRRCEKDYFQSYLYYDRGITVCEEWKKFSNFLNDMGERPKGCSIERINNDAGYSKENCVWADNFTQANNKRNNVFIEYKGQRKTISQWAMHFGMNYNSFQTRRSRGWSMKKIEEKAMAIRALINLEV